MKPAVRFAPREEPVQSARLLVADVAILALAGVWHGVAWTVREAVSYGRKCHWLP